MRVIFEGVDLMGKTTLVEAVNKELIRRGYTSYARHAIKSTDIGNSLYRIASSHGVYDNEHVKQLLFAACKHLELEEQSEIAKDSIPEPIFLVDRWWPSAAVYGGQTVDETLTMVNHMNYVTTDLIFYINFDKDLFKSRLVDVHGGLEADALEPDLEKAIVLANLYEREVLPSISNLITVWPNDPLEQSVHTTADKIIKEYVNVNIKRG